MIVLHGTWKPIETLENRGGFFIWGESSSSTAKRRGRIPKADTQRTHPFQASEKDLRRVIESLDPESGSVIRKKARPDNVVLMLPSFSMSPQASPDLLRDEESAEETVCLSPWKVDGLCIQPEDAVLLLSLLSGAWTQTDGAASEPI